MMLAEAWAATPLVERQREIGKLVEIETLNEDYERPNYLDLVRAPGEFGVYASTGPNYQQAVFGRDSLEVGEDKLETDPGLVRNIIVTMASLQGVRFDPKSEEEPGKAHHEFRSKTKFGPLNQESMNRLLRQQKQWGGEGTDDMCYYGAVDSTLLYIRLVCSYVQKYGDEILDTKYLAKANPLNPGETEESRTRTIRESVIQAAVWAQKKQAESNDHGGWNTVEFNRLNKMDGHTIQTWKDSDSSYLHLSGERCNFEDGVASIEMQGLLYDCYKQIAYLFTQTDEEKNEWLNKAKEVQRDTLERYWMEDRQFFAQGLDRDPATGETRQIQTLTSNVSQLLDSDLLLDLDEEEHRKYVVPVITQLMSSNFLTPAGIRCRAIEHKELMPFPDYHGSYVTWPKDTEDAANGFRRLGFHNEADRLEDGILKSVKIAGEFYEFFYVEEDNKVWYDGTEAMKHFANRFHEYLIHMPLPETGQAWVISAVEKIMHERSKRRFGHMADHVIPELVPVTNAISAA